MRAAAVGDVHVGRSNTRVQVARLHDVGADADLLLLAGDITDHGRVEQAEQLADEVSRVKVPIVTVLGNHDFEHGRPFAVADALERVGVRVLDGTSAVFGNVGVAGVKGFGGGFDPRQLGSFGEPLMKNFVAEIEQEAEKLAHALARLRTPHKIALMHYAPITATLEGEPREIFPFLGSSKLAHAAEKHGATLILHGHAHAGTFAGVTPAGVPVYRGPPEGQVRWPGHPRGRAGVQRRGLGAPPARPAACLRGLRPVRLSPLLARSRGSQYSAWR
jgi:Icc-related predicted phosphoesterase